MNHCTMENISRTGTSPPNAAFASFSCSTLPSQNGNCLLAMEGYLIIASLCTPVKLMNISAFTAGCEQHAVNQDQGHTQQISVKETTELGCDREMLAVKKKKLKLKLQEYELHFQFPLAFELAENKH